MVTQDKNRRVANIIIKIGIGRYAKPQNRDKGIRII